MMCPTSNMIILLIVSISVSTAIHQPQYMVNDDQNELSNDINWVPSSEREIQENAMESQKTADGNHPRDVNKILDKYIDLTLEINVKNENDQGKVLEKESEIINKEQNVMTNESKHPKQLTLTESIPQDVIPDRSDDEEISNLNLDTLKHMMELNNFDKEKITNLKVALNSNVFVSSGLQEVFKKLFINSQELGDSTNTNIEKPDVKSSVKISKTSNVSLEGIAEFQLSNTVAKALAEFQASNIIQQAIAEFKSSNTLQNAMKELQKSPAVKHVLAQLQASTAINKKIVEGLSSVQKVMTEATEILEKAMADHPNALQEAMARIHASNTYQEILAGLLDSNISQRFMEKINNLSDGQEDAKKLMLLNAIKEGNGEAQLKDAFKKTINAEKITSDLQNFLSEAQAKLVPQEEMGLLQNLEGITDPMDILNAFNEVAEDTDSALLQVAMEDVHNEDQESLSDFHFSHSVQDNGVQLTSTDDLTYEKTEAEDQNELE